MNCPNCGHVGLENKIVDEDSLHVSECPQCKGYWLSAASYWVWLKQHGEILPHKEPEEVIEAEDSTTVKVCPECMKIMPSYHIGHGTSNRIERCSTCAGVWFDENEWELLKSRNLHDEIHRIFSRPWQDSVKKEEQEKRYETIVCNIVGDEDFEKVKEFKLLIKNHKAKSTILAFLNN